MCLAFVCLLLTAGRAGAHRVNIFAYVDGPDIVAECGFNRSSRVRQGLVEVFDAVTGAKIAEGRTGDSGIFRFPVPAADIRNGHGLRIHINAGEGHENDWIMDASELNDAIRALPGGEGGSATACAPPALPADPPASLPAVPGQGGWATPADVERIVDAALSARLAPIQRLLARQSEGGPKLADIIGGIGWIFGLAGVAAYFRRRR
ncbi:MAG: hypothetical protein J1E80_03155 [Desulfovibrionaceae bacterium]|nr:hypothetical protein [Desulfovibrionaceae bacterium]